MEKLKRENYHILTNKNIETRTGDCNICGANIPIRKCTRKSKMENDKTITSWACGIRAAERSKGYNSTNVKKRQERKKLGIPLTEKEAKRKIKNRIFGLKIKFQNLEELNSLIDSFYLKDCCEICGITQQEHLKKSKVGKGKAKRLCVDHCHKTGAARGYLCNNCNLGLGSFDDSIEKLQNSISYLEKYNKEIENKTQKSPPIEGQGNL